MKNRFVAREVIINFSCCLAIIIDYLNFTVIRAAKDLEILILQDLLNLQVHQGLLIHLHLRPFTKQPESFEDLKTFKAFEDHLIFVAFKD